MRNENNWFKLFALMVVGGVAKSLFGPPPAPRITQYIDQPEKPKSDNELHEKGQDPFEF
jgi:hypothetical protein